MIPYSRKSNDPGTPSHYTSTDSYMNPQYKKLYLYPITSLLI